MAAPRVLRLKVASDGTPEGTRVLDAAAGEPLCFDAVMAADVAAGPGGGRAKITLVFHDVPVELTAEVAAPFFIQGHTVGAAAAPPMPPAPAVRAPHPAAPARPGAVRGLGGG
jgi:hypothetical protein